MTLEAGLARHLESYKSYTPQAISDWWNFYSQEAKHLHDQEAYRQRRIPKPPCPHNSKDCTHISRSPRSKHTVRTPWRALQSITPLDADFVPEWVAQLSVERSRLEERLQSIVKR